MKCSYLFLFAAILVQLTGRTSLAAGPAAAPTSQGTEPVYQGRTLAQWITMAEDGDLASRKEAAVALGKLGPAAVPTLVEMLKHLWIDYEGDLRQVAARALGDMGPEAKAAIPALKELLHTYDRSVRGTAVWALGKIGPAAVPALTEVLKDKDAEIRKRAAWALGDIGPSTISLLTELLKDKDSWVRCAAAGSLGRIGRGAKPAVPDLAGLLEDRDAYVRLGSARALWRIDATGSENKAAIPVLTKLLQHEDALVRYNAADVLERFGPEAKSVPALAEVLKERDGSTQWYAAPALSGIDPSAIPDLTGLVQSVKSKRGFVTVNMSDLAPDAKAAIPAVRELLKDKNGWVRLDAASVLAKIDPEGKAAVAALVELLRETQPRGIPAIQLAAARFAAAEALRKFGPAAVPALVELLRDKDARVRRAAVVSLKKIGPGAKTAVLALADLLRDDRDQWDRQNAREALENIGPAAVPALRELLKDKDAEFRRAVAEILWEIGPMDKTAIPALVELLANRVDQFRPAVGQLARMTAFLAEEKGKPAADFPAWNDYREIVGNTPASRRLFGEMLATEPELCASIGGDPKRLGELLAMRTGELNDPRSTRRVGCQPGLGSIAAVFFVAVRPDVAPFFNDDRKTFDAVDTTLRWGMSPKCRRMDWSNPDPEGRVVKELANRWAIQEGDPNQISLHIMIVWHFHLGEAEVPLLLRLLRQPQPIVPPLSGMLEHAVLTVRKLGRKENRPLLAKFLDWAGILDVRWRTPSLPDPQFRDLVLGVIVELSGKRPEEYGFVAAPPGTAGGRPVYLFQTAEQRNRGFALAIKNYRELGLEKPPKYTPEIPPRFVFVAGTKNHGDLRISLASPDGKTRLDLRGNKARLIDVATGRPIGQELDAGKLNEGPNPELTFTCGAFSPDGKYVVTGSSIVKRFPPREDTVDTNVGHVEVWDAATGEPVEKQTRGRTGSIRAVGFDKDGKVIYYDADRFSLDIS